jgi:hypothetical protein
MVVSLPPGEARLRRPLVSTQQTVVLDSRDVKRAMAGGSVLLLVAIAGYSIYVAVVASATRGGKHYTPWMFWTAIAFFWLIAAASLWGAHRIFRRRFVNS